MNDDNDPVAEASEIVGDELHQMEGELNRDISELLGTFMDLAVAKNDQDRARRISEYQSEVLAFGDVLIPKTLLAEITEYLGVDLND